MYVDEEANTGAVWAIRGPGREFNVPAPASPASNDAGSVDTRYQIAILQAEVGNAEIRKSCGIFMKSLIRVQQKGQVTIPSRLRTQAGLSDGDLVEIAFQGGKIVLTPKVVIDRSALPPANDEYTPEQRRIVDARLAESDEDIKQGRVYGPFNSADEMIASVKAELKKRAAAKRAPHSR